MGELRLWAIEIPLVRRLVPADPTLAPRLREIWSERFRVPAVERHSPGLLSKLGPLLLRAPDAPVLPPGTPTHNDVEGLIAGRFTSPERLPVAWTAFTAWLDELAWGRLELPLQPGELDQLEFDLTLAGLPADHCPRRLMSRDTQLMLRPIAGQSFGYTRNDFARSCAEQVSGVLDQIDPRSSLAAARLADFLRQYPAWSADAQEAGRPAPDLFAMLVE